MWQVSEKTVSALADTPRIGWAVREAIALACTKRGETIVVRQTFTFRECLSALFGQRFFPREPQCLLKFDALGQWHLGWYRDPRPRPKAIRYSRLPIIGIERFDLYL